MLNLKTQVKSLVHEMSLKRSTRYPWGTWLVRSAITNPKDRFTTVSECYWISCDKESGANNLCENCQVWKPFHWPLEKLQVKFHHILGLDQSHKRNPNYFYCKYQNHLGERKFIFYQKTFIQAFLPLVEICPGRNLQQYLLIKKIV